MRKTCASQQLLRAADTTELQENKEFLGISHGTDIAASTGRRRLATPATQWRFAEVQEILQHAPAGLLLASKSRWPARKDANCAE